MPQFFENVVHVLGLGLDGERAGRAAEATVASALTLVEVEVNDRNVFRLDIFPAIDFSPVQQPVDADVGPVRKGRLELVPQLRGLLAEVPISVFATGREVTLIGTCACLIGPQAEARAGIAFIGLEILK